MQLIFLLHVNLVLVQVSILYAIHVSASFESVRLYVLGKCSVGPEGSPKLLIILKLFGHLRWRRRHLLLSLSRQWVLRYEPGSLSGQLLMTTINARLVYGLLVIFQIYEPTSLYWIMTILVIHESYLLLVSWTVKPAKTILVQLVLLTHGISVERHLHIDDLASFIWFETELILRFKEGRIADHIVLELLLSHSIRLIKLWQGTLAIH